MTSHPREQLPPIDRVRALRGLIEDRAARDEAATELSRDVTDALYDAGLFALVAPREVGGEEAHPDVMIDVVRELSYYDGSTGWYAEDAQPNPINVYGRTKLAAERKVLENPSYTVVRIVLTAGTSENRDRSFVEDMIRTAKSGKNLTLYADEFRCPLPAGAVARALWELAEQDKPGLYHLGGSERLSRWEIGEILLPWFPELRGRLIRGTARDHQGAPRPRDLSLTCRKLQSLLSFPIPGLRSWLAGRKHAETDLWDYE